MPGRGPLISVPLTHEGASVDSNPVGRSNPRGRVSPCPSGAAQRLCLNNIRTPTGTTGLSSASETPERLMGPVFRIAIWCRGRNRTGDTMIFNFWLSPWSIVTSPAGDVGATSVR